MNPKHSLLYKFALALTSLLVIIPLLFMYHAYREIYIMRTYGKLFKGYFAVEIVNRTDEPLSVRFVSDNESTETPFTIILPGESATLLAQPPNAGYKVEIRNENENENPGFIHESYASQLPEHTNQLVVEMNGTVQSQIVVNDSARLERYRNHLSLRNNNGRVEQ